MGTVTNHRLNFSVCLHQHHSYQDMNTRCASTLFVVAMSVIAVVYGAPADATVGASNLGCYCTPTKAQALGNTYKECPKPDQFAVCMTHWWTNVNMNLRTSPSSILSTKEKHFSSLMQQFPAAMLQIATTKLQSLTNCRLFTKKGHPYNLMGTKNY